MQEQFDDLLADDEFWSYQGCGLAVFSMLEMMRACLLAKRLADMVEVSDRFHTKSLLRNHFAAWDQPGGGIRQVTRLLHETNRDARMHLPS